MYQVRRVKDWEGREGILKQGSGNKEDEYAVYGTRIPKNDETESYEEAHNSTHTKEHI